MVKIVLVGDSGSGKSKLIDQVSPRGPQFTRSFMGGTEEEPFIPEVLPIKERTIAERYCQVWDVRGKHDDPQRAQAYPSTDVYVICFSLDSQEQFEHVGNFWIPELTRTHPSRFILCGTKSDLERTVDADAIQLLAEHHQTRSIECSSKSPQNVIQVFELAVSLVPPDQRDRSCCSTM